MALPLPYLLKRLSKPRHAAPVAVATPAASPARLSTAQQWTRLAGVLRTAIEGATEARLRQSAATQQLDLAQYALYTLGDELAAVMTVPGRREPASVHVLEARTAAAAKSKALAA